MPISSDELARRKKAYSETLRELTLEMCCEEKGIGAVEAAPLLQFEAAYAGSIINNAITVETLVDKWLSNFRHNYLNHILVQNMAPYFRFASAVIIEDVEDTDVRSAIRIDNSAICVGAGPSTTANQLEALKDYKGKVICTNKVLSSLLKYRVPDLVVVLDADESVLDSFTPISVQEVSQELRFMLATAIDPAVSSWLAARTPKSQMHWFNASIPDDYMPNADYLIRTFSANSIPTIDTGGNAGLFAIAMAKELGAKTIGLLGMEHSHRLSSEWTNEQALTYKIVFAPEDKQVFAITPSFQGYLNNLISWVKNTPEVEFVNLCKFGWLYVMREKIPIRHMTVKEFVKDHD